MNPSIRQSYDALFSRWGAQHWWPAQSRLEMMVGAILTQNTAWTNVEKAIEALRSVGALNLNALEMASTKQVADWIRPAGYFNQKADYLKGMVDSIRCRFDGSLDKLFALDTPTLREELLSWKGIGPETADSILLYAGKRPVFVVDAYTRRMCLRHGWIDEKTSYDTIAKLFTDHLPEDAQLFNEFHALIVRLGKEHCNTKPKCSGCPLEPFLKQPVTI
ncbi:MAG TPA: endonuclease III domain-containing protein [Pontiella sp.]|nr:endonuclease III domain-containing protein [Pontiella sp.]